jgi:hypothetical protein
MSDSKMSRRTLLSVVPGALGAAALGGKLAAQEYQIHGADIKLGIASYSFRKFNRTQAIQMAKELGTPYLNVKDFHLKLDASPEEIDAAKKEFADAGIILVGCGNVSFAKDDEADIKSKFEYAKRAGFPLIVCAPTAETLPKLEKYVKEYDIKIAVHNHGPEDKNFPTPQSVLKAVKGMDPRCWTLYGYWAHLAHRCRYCRIDQRSRSAAARHAYQGFRRYDEEGKPSARGRWKTTHPPHLRAIDQDEIPRLREFGI